MSADQSDRAILNLAQKLLNESTKNFVLCLPLHLPLLYPDNQNIIYKNTIFKMLTFFGVTKNKNVNLTEGDNATVLAEKLLCIFKWVDFHYDTNIK